MTLAGAEDIATKIEAKGLTLTGTGLTSIGASTKSLDAAVDMISNGSKYRNPKEVLNMTPQNTGTPNS